jgi:nicotinate-nucleotide adenylyltransferase
VTVLFGGAFDPVHAGHLEIADAAKRQFSLDRIIFLPSGNPPHKPLRTPFADRVAMLRLACPSCEISEIENTSEPTYTFNTLHHFPEPRAFLIGADAFAEIETWYRWRDVVRMTEFLVISRPGHEYRIPEGARVRRLDTVAVPYSSSAIRAALARGERPDGLPDAVYDYIRAKGLYRTCVQLASS